MTETIQAAIDFQLENVWNFGTLLMILGALAAGLSLTIEFKKKNFSTKQHEDPRRGANALILMVFALSSRFFV